MRKLYLRLLSWALWRGLVTFRFAMRRLRPGDTLRVRARTYACSLSRSTTL